MSISALHTQSIPNDFSMSEEATVLKNLFTINTGVMRFHKRGNINDINSIDSETIIKHIRENLQNISSLQLDQKSLLLHCIEEIEKTTSNLKPQTSMLRKQIKATKPHNLNRYNKEIIKLLKASPSLSPHRTKWFENYLRPVYHQNISEEIIDYKIGELKTICQSHNPPIDILLTGDIEKLHNRYLVTIIVYSSLLNEVIYKTAFATTPDTIPEQLAPTMKKVLKNIFNINYGELTVETDENTEIYINNHYLSKEQIHIPFIAPDTYRLTLIKEHTQTHSEIITIRDNEQKQLKITPEITIPKQAYTINIEPAGTKIFINSRYSGTTPYKTELPKGNYTISAKASELYQDYRYNLEVDEISENEKIIQFHLMTKNFDNFLKLKQNLYYTAFWGFTFSLAVTIPTLIIAVQYYPAPMTLINLSEQARELASDNPDRIKLEKKIKEMQGDSAAVIYSDWTYN